MAVETLDTEQVPKRVTQTGRRERRGVEHEPAKHPPIIISRAGWNAESERM